MYKQLTYNNAVLQYQLFGRGPAVVLLHGFAEDSSVWRHLAEGLAARFHVIVPDFPGSGRSALGADVRMEALADAVQFILDSERIETSVVIGHSMGGYVALAYAEKYAMRLSGFGLFHSSALPDDDEKKETREKGISFIQTHGAPAFLKTALANLYSPATKKEKPALIEKQLEAAVTGKPEALIAYYEAMMLRPDRTIVLRQATVPVLFVLGRHDATSPLQSGLAQSHLPPQAYIHLLEQSGHMGLVEEPEASLHLLHQFLSETLQPL